MKTPPGNTLGGQCLRNAEKQGRRSWEVISYVYPVHPMQIRSRRFHYKVKSLQYNKRNSGHHYFREIDLTFSVFEPDNTSFIFQ